MRGHRQLPQRRAGARAGKLVADPVVWFAVNAQIDGVDPGSDIAAERLKYVVYQRRLLVEALKTKAMLYAMLGEADRASQAAKEYFDMAFPVSKEAAEQARARKEKALADIEKMGPLRMVNGKLTSSPPAREGFPSAPRTAF